MGLDTTWRALGVGSSTKSPGQSEHKTGLVSSSRFPCSVFCICLLTGCHRLLLLDKLRFGEPLMPLPALLLCWLSCSQSNSLPIQIFFSRTQVHLRINCAVHIISFPLASPFTLRNGRTIVLPCCNCIALPTPPLNILSSRG